MDPRPPPHRRRAGDRSGFACGGHHPLEPSPCGEVEGARPLADQLREGAAGLARVHSPSAARTPPRENASRFRPPRKGVVKGAAGPEVIPLIVEADLVDEL